MFSGIIEAQVTVVAGSEESGLIRLQLERPAEFDDLHRGDSLATNGVCLTIESFDDRQITLAVAAETIRVTGWTLSGLKKQKLNLERSLRTGDRVHGHFVSGHVDAMGELVSRKVDGESLWLDILAPHELAKFVWRKGSWALNGVSLTINSVTDTAKGPIINHCLIPETLQRTNLGAQSLGARLCLEVDMVARAWQRNMQLKEMSS